jgi:MFS family permease
LGLAIGPVLGSALSETQGRKKLLVLPPLASVFFGLMATTTLHFPVFLAARFLQGLLGATPVSVGGASLVDIWGGAYATTWPLACMLLFSFSGAIVSPTFVSLLLPLSDWRSAGWACVLFGAGVALLLACALRETHEGTLLQRQACALRIETGEWAWHAPADLVHTDVKRLVHVYLARPLVMLARELMLALLSI